MARKSFMCAHWFHPLSCRQACLNIYIQIQSLLWYVRAKPSSNDFSIFQYWASFVACQYWTSFLLQVPRSSTVPVWVWIRLFRNKLPSIRVTSLTWLTFSRYLSLVWLLFKRFTSASRWTFSTVCLDFLQCLVQGSQTHCSEGQMRTNKVTRGPRYDAVSLNIIRNSFYIVLPAKGIVSCRRITSNRLCVRLKGVYSLAEHF